MSATHLGELLTAGGGGALEVVVDFCLIRMAFLASQHIRRRRTGCMRTLCLIVCLTCLQTSVAFAARYAANDNVPVWANKIGPYSSPTESYGFYDALPWCRPANMASRSLRLGEALSGDKLIRSPYVLPFRQPVASEQLCQIAYTRGQVDEFAAAIQKKYAYDLLVDDDLPVKLFVGEASSDEKQFLFTHITFDVSYNGDRIIEVNALPGNPVELVRGSTATVQFTYDVKWRATDFPYQRRSEKYKNPANSRNVEIHWYGIVNSLLSVFLLMAFLATVLLRVIRRELHDYAMQQGDDANPDDYGWKQVYGDVFRFPQSISLLCPFLGTGVQLLVLTVVLLILGALEIFHPLSRGAIYTAVLCTYVATAWIAGYVSGYIYKQLGGSAWIRNALCTVVVFCGPVGVIMTCLHSVALVYQSTRAVPIWAIAALAALWTIVTIPLSLFGSILGKNNSRPFPSSCIPNKIPREIPPCPWYRATPFMVVMCGLMPFSSIYLEVYEMFSSIWGHHIYEIYELLAIVFVILNLVTIITTMAAVYFQLGVENYCWWWNSLLYGGSVSMYFLAYSLFYFYLRSPLEGFMQGSYFFGYTLFFSYALFLQCGTVGFFSARWFVLFLYRQIKSD